MALPKLAEMVPTRQQAVDFVTTQGKNLAFDAAKVTGACLITGAAVSALAPFVPAFGTAYAACSTCTAVGATTSSLLGSVVPAGMQTTVVCKSLEALAGTALFFARDLKNAPKLANVRSVTLAQAKAFALDQAKQLAQGTLKVGGACVLMGSIAKLVPAVGGISFANCTFCEPSRKVLAGAVSSLPGIGTSPVASCLETLGGLGAFFNRSVPTLATKTWAMMPESIRGVSTTDDKSGKAD